MNRPTIWAGPLLALALGIAAPARAQDADTAPDQRFALHGQTTVTAQGDAGFTAPYAGTNSLTPGQVRETIDVTLFGGMRLWKGAEIWVNGEMDQGFGLSDTLGVAGFTSGEAYKVGSRTPYVRLQRGFLRQTIALGGDALHIDAAANTLRQTTTSDRVVITVGKFGVGDVFDTNSYAHDPRADFLNWSVIDTGSFDYAADAWGYSLGAAAEWYQADWAVRFGLFNLSTEPNGTVLETSYAQNQMIVESEHRHKLGGHPGVIRVSFWRNHGRFENLDTALAIYRGIGALPEASAERRPATRAGEQIDAEQEITDSVGVFLRAGLANGHYETYDFTDIDRTVALGGQIKGDIWNRKDDRVGVATVVNGISKTREAFLNAGGLGVLVGDGRLPHPGPEWITEAYYDWKVMPGIDLTADYQFVQNPGYNRDRGPVNVVAFRLHGQF